MATTMNDVQEQERALIGVTRSAEHLPEFAQKALADREAAIARGEAVPEFDADGFEVTSA